MVFRGAYFVKRALTYFARSIVVVVVLHCGFAAGLGKDTWTKVRSSNFLLVGNASEKEIRDVAVRLEQFRDGFTRLLTGFRFTSAASTTVVVFKNNESFEPFKPVYRGKTNSIAGYFQSGEDVNYITLTTEQTTEDPYHTIFHEYVHLLLHNTIRNVPPWFDEGLAEYYSTFNVGDNGRKVLLGRLIPGHIQLMRSDRLLPLQTLLNVDRKSPYYNERDKTGMFYAESWALVHYLVLGNDRKRQRQIGAYLELIRDGAKPETAFQEAFRTDYLTLENELQAYVARKSFPAQEITLPERINSSINITSSRISEAEARAHLGNLLLHIDRLDDAARILEQSLALEPRLALAHASLGIVRVKQKQFGEAIVHLKKAEAADPSDYLVHYYHAFALSRATMDETLTVTDYEPKTVELMRSELRKAIELNPAFSDSYTLLAFINLTRDEQLDESIQLVRHALALAPGRDDYVFVLAQLYVRKQDFITARQVLQPMLRENADETIRQSATTLLGSIKRIEDQLERLKAANKVAEENGVSSSSGDGTLKEVTLESFLRKPQKGEQRVRGLLNRVECVPGTILFFIDAGGQSLTLHASRLERVRFVTYTPGIGKEMVCGQRRPPNDVVVTFRPLKELSARIDGEIVSVEFVPSDFQLLNP